MSQKVKPKRTVGYPSYGHFSTSIAPFDQLFTHKVNVQEAGTLEGIDCLILWGGSDIHPSLYKQTHSRLSGASKEPSERDKWEWSALLWCKKNDIPVIGICRGAQMGCVFSGGSLAQHVARHGSDHMIETHRGDKMWTTSVHHQMMNVHGVPHEMLAWSAPALSDIYLDGDDKQIKEMEESVEPEIVYFTETRILGIQGHPEYGSSTHAFKKLCVDLAAEYLFGEKQ